MVELPTHKHKGRSMRKPMKLAAGAAAIAAPILIGWVLTSAPLNEAGLFDEEDQWHFETNGELYVVDRTESNDLVTIVVTGPDGSLVDPESVPADIAEHLELVDDPNWLPAEDKTFDIIDDQPCYHAAEVDADTADQSEDVEAEDANGQMALSNGDGTFVIQVENGAIVQKAYFSDSDIDQEELDDYQMAGGSYSDLEGAQELTECP